MMDDEIDGHFIPGVYNYCDRWCERCRLTGRCRNFEMGERRRGQRMDHGDDVDRWDSVYDEVKESFEDALTYLSRMAEEAGVDLEGLEVTPMRSRREPHPLQAHADAIFRQCRPLLARLGEILAEERANLEALPDGPPEEEEIALMRRENAFEIIQWYHTLLVPKTHRALDRQVWDDGRESEEEYPSDDARGTAKLVHECLDRLLGALHCVRRGVPELEAQAANVMRLAFRLRGEIVAAVPGCLEYHRPGLDD